jgi:predicted GIY-YIG superfamily endonuclease
MNDCITAGPGVYLLCYADHPYKHAAHYTGYADNIARRIAQHRRGEGARLMQVVVEHHISFAVAKIWPEETRQFERKLHKRHGAARYCPICRGEVTPARPPVRRLSYPVGRRRPMPDRMLSVYFP